MKEYQETLTKRERNERGENSDDDSKTDETYEPRATMNELWAGLASLLLGVDFIT